MTAKLDYKWNLRAIMADCGMFSTTDLRPLLLERGIERAATQIWRLVTEKPERLNLKKLVTLMDILGCRMDQLIEPIATASQAKPAAPTTAADSGVGSFRPKRARIVPDQQ